MAVNTTNIQELAMKYANTIASSINEGATSIAGVEVMWFRSIPQQRSTDVIFQTYTLHNVEACPKTLKVLYADTAYNDAELTYTIMGIDYKPGLTLEVDVNTWNKAMEFDGSQPQQRDIVYIPLTHKLWEVNTMTPIMSIASVTTSYKMSMKTYEPKADRLVNGELKEAIDANTVNIDKLFGKAIDDVKEDLTDKKQLSRFSSTVKDETKDLKKFPEKSDILFNKRANYIFPKDIEVDGHIVAKSYYDMTNKRGIIVEYKDIDDFVASTDTRCYSAWINIQRISEKFNVTSISEIERDKRNVKLLVKTTKDKNFNIGDIVLLKRNTIMLRGEIQSINDNGITINYGITTIRKTDNVIENWKTLSGFTLSNDDGINLLSGDSDNGEFSIDLYDEQLVTITINNKVSNVPLKSKLEIGKWYGIIINLNTQANVNVFKSEDKLEKISETNVNIVWNDNTYNRYFIKASNTYITNIRYYIEGETNINTQLTDLVSYNIKNNSKAIINDSADVYIENEYYGEQR
jgi:hypothetical protein